MSKAHETNFDPATFLFISVGADTVFQRGQSNWQGSSVSPSPVCISGSASVITCFAYNVNTLIRCSSVQDQLKPASPWEDSIP